MKETLFLEVFKEVQDEFDKAEEDYISLSEIIHNRCFEEIDDEIKQLLLEQEKILDEYITIISDMMWLMTEKEYV